MPDCTPLKVSPVFSFLKKSVFQLWSKVFDTFWFDFVEGERYNSNFISWRQKSNFPKFSGHSFDVSVFSSLFYFIGLPVYFCANIELFFSFYHDNSIEKFEYFNTHPQISYHSIVTLLFRIAWLIYDPFWFHVNSWFFSKPGE